MEGEKKKKNRIVVGKAGARVVVSGRKMAAVDADRRRR